MIIRIAFLLIPIFFSNASSAQNANDKITYLNFEFYHSRRIPFHRVTVEIIKRQNEIVVEVHSSPMDARDKRWQSSKIDKSFTIDEKVFDALTNKVLQLKETNLENALVSGADGTDCAIEFGAPGNTITYKFWSPDYDTNRRGLNNFLSLCKEFVEIGGLNPDEVLDIE